jgi:copper(I)-binding protein
MALRFAAFRAWPFVVMLALLHLAPCGAADDAAPGKAAPIEVRDAWIRWLPANVPDAGYMTLTNTGSNIEVLSSASSVDFGEVSIHQTHDDMGMSGMMPVKSITIQPHATVRFVAGGYHLMLMQPKRPLHPGDTVQIVLHFANGGSATVQFPIRAGN